MSFKCAKVEFQLSNVMYELGELCSTRECAKTDTEYQSCMSTLCKRGDAYATQEVSYSAASSVFAALFSSVEVTTSIATFIIGKNNLTSSTPFFSVLIFCIYQDRFSSTELEPNNKNLLILNYLLLLFMMYENYQKCLIRTFRWPKVIKIIKTLI